MKTRRVPVLLVAVFYAAPVLAEGRVPTETRELAPGHPGPVSAAAFSPDGKTLASGASIYEHKGARPILSSSLHR